MKVCIKYTRLFLCLLVLVLAFSFISCSDEANELKTENVEPTRKDVLLDYALFQDYKMTEDEVENSLMSFLSAGNESKGLNSSSFNIKKIDGGTVTLENKCVSKALASAEQDDILFSVYEVENQTENKSGFAITSDDKRIGDVLCYIDDGEFSTDISDNPAMIVFASCLEDYVDETQVLWNSITDEDIQALKDEYGITDEDIERAKQELESSKATYSYGDWYLSRGDKNKTLITTNWNQNPYSIYTKGIYAVYGKPYYAGCAATSTAQLMAYWGWPTKYTSSNLSTLKSKWSAIKDWDGTYSWDAIKNGNANNQIGALLYEVAEGLGMSYGTYADNGSSAKYNSEEKFLCNHGYKQDGHSESGFFASIVSEGGATVVAESLDKNRPVIIDACATEKRTKHGWWLFSWYTYSYENGHSWLLDGYYQLSRSVTERKKILFWTKTNHYTERQLYVHCNFGWGGSNNGWYKYGVFNTTNGNFQYKISAQCNIYPKR